MKLVLMNNCFSTTGVSSWGGSSRFSFWRRSRFSFGCSFWSWLFMFLMESKCTSCIFNRWRRIGSSELDIVFQGILWWWNWVHVFKDVIASWTTWSRHKICHGWSRSVFWKIKWIHFLRLAEWPCNNPKQADIPHDPYESSRSGTGKGTLNTFSTNPEWA